MTFRFSANTGYLWKELPFLERIRQAGIYGFDAVEFHDEAQSVDRASLKDVLDETELPVLSLNIRMGPTTGIAACPHQAEQAKRDIAEAIEVAESVDAGGVHVLGGISNHDDAAHRTYIENLRFALNNTDRMILIEPVCEEQLAGFFLQTLDQAEDIIRELEHPRLKILFDCYHVHRQSGAVSRNFKRCVANIGHVQISAAEARAEPFPGVLDYSVLLPEFQVAGYTGAFGCEYRPQKDTQSGLGWRTPFVESRQPHKTSF